MSPPPATAAPAPRLEAPSDPPGHLPPRGEGGAGRAAAALYGVLLRPRTYGNLLYLLLSFPLGLLYAGLLGFWAAVGAVLSVVGVGLVMLVGCLVAAWGMAMVERELAIGLLGADVPPMSLPDAEVLPPWPRLVAHLRRPVTWKSLAFLVLKLPFGMLAATATSVLVGGSLALIAIPGAVVAKNLDLLDLPRLLGLASLSAIGVTSLAVSLHAVNWVGRGWGALACTMLGIGEEERQVWEARRRADAADRARRELILNVSHELRTPIASIQGHVDTLLLPDEERPADATAERYLSVVSSETRRLGTLVEDLLDLARADANELTVLIREVGLAGVLRSVALSMAPLARRERNVTVALAEPLPDLVALADPDRLTQVLGNLVRNAVTNTPEGGAVLLQLTELPPDRVGVDVSDTGTGIPLAEQERIFQRFYRRDPSRSRDSGGFGLGLSIARELAEAMGGGITVTSEPGLGSTFRVTLRRA